jgi:hypothetical protein
MSDSSDTTRIGIRSRFVDVIVVVAIFAVAATVADLIAAASGGRAFVEWETTPAVMLACGRGFTLPVSESPVLVDFQTGRRPAMSCADIADDRPGTSPVRVALSEKYGLYGAALALRLGGISWRALDAYVGGLCGLSMVFAYLLFRLVAGRLPALLGVVSLICSGHLVTLTTFRDYGKAPCFLALWLTLGWLLRRNCAGVSRKIVLPACVGGFVLGLGLGFRPDVLVCVPAFVAVIALAIRGFGPSDLWLKAVAMAAFVLAFVVTGWPVLSGMAGGNNSAHVIILGLTTSFNRTLDLEPAVYDVGDAYSDGYVYTMITSHAVLVQHEPQPVVFGSARYDRLGAGLLADVARHFPADVVTRALAATAQVLRHPFDPIARDADLAASFGQWPSIWDAARRYGLALDTLERSALWLSGIVFLAVSMRDWRLGAAGGALVLYFCGYSMLQFSRRHTFHLDVIPIGIVVIALDWIIRLVPRFFSFARMASPKDPATPRMPFATPLAGVAVVGASIFAILLTVMATRTSQQRHVRALLDQTLALSWEEVPTTQEPLSKTVLRQGVPVAAWDAAFTTQRDLWSTALLLRVPPPPFSREALEAKDDFVDTSYLQVEVGDSRCEATVLIGLKYTAFAETAHREFTRVFEIRPEGGPSRLLVPAFYVHGPYWTRFDGFAVPAAAASCITAVRRATSTEAVPLPILAAVLAPNWRTKPLYQQMKDMPGFVR